MPESNRKYFTGLSPLEELFIRPDDDPRTILPKFEALMSEWRKLRNWPAKLKCTFDYEDYQTDGSRGEIEIWGGVNIRGGRWIKGDKNSLITGPVLLGDNVVLRNGAVIVGPAFIGDNVIVGQDCRIIRSVVRRGAHLSFGARVADSVLGRNTILGDGVRIEGKMLDEKPSVYLRRSKKASSQDGDRRLGLIAGDGCEFLAGVIFGSRVLAERYTKVEAGTPIREGSTLSKTVRW